MDGRRGTSAKALKASKGAGARISSDYLATPSVPKFAPSGNTELSLTSQSTILEHATPTLFSVESKLAARYLAL